MKKLNIYMLISAVLMVGIYFTPLWRIKLNAPQYPETVGLYIWVNTITGLHKNDLQNINTLNHYIGMQYVVPDAIPELKYLPKVMGFFILFGLLTAFMNKKWLTWVWIIALSAILAYFLYRYSVWAYDYGTNLDPRAALKVPGADFIPPLIGSKQMLNMVTNSWPYLGSYLIGISMLFAFLSLDLVKFGKK